MAKKSIAELKKEIASLEKDNKELEQRKKLEDKLSRLKKGVEPGRSKKPSIQQRVRGAKRKVRSFLGPIGDSFDESFG